MTDLRDRLEALATDESEDEETRAWALDVLEGRDRLADPRRPKSADGGEGSGRWIGNAPAHGDELMNESIREAARRSRYG